MPCICGELHACVPEMKAEDILSFSSEASKPMQDPDGMIGLCLKGYRARLGLRNETAITIGDDLWNARAFLGGGSFGHAYSLPAPCASCSMQCHSDTKP